MSDVHLPQPLPPHLAALARDATRADVSEAERRASHARMLARFERGHRGQLERAAPMWHRGAPVLAGATAVLAVALGTSFVGRHRPADDGATIQAKAETTTPASAGTTVAQAVPDADAVISALRPAFRGCYEEALRENPTTSGSVVIAAVVGPTGRVSSADIASIDGLSTGVALCIVGVVKRAQFAATGSGSTLRIPITFAQKR